MINATLRDRFLVRTALRLAVEAVHNRIRVADIYHSMDSPATRMLLISNVLRLRSLLRYLMWDPKLMDAYVGARAYVKLKDEHAEEGDPMDIDDAVPGVINAGNSNVGDPAQKIPQFVTLGRLEVRTGGGHHAWGTGGRAEENTIESGHPAVGKLAELPKSLTPRDGARATKSSSQSFAVAIADVLAGHALGGLSAEALQFKRFKDLKFEPVGRDVWRWAPRCTRE